jgi:hypothetical protein
MGARTTEQLDSSGGKNEGDRELWATFSSGGGVLKRSCILQENVEASAA